MFALSSFHRKPSADRYFSFVNVLMMVRKHKCGDVETAGSSQRRGRVFTVLMVRLSAVLSSGLDASFKHRERRRLLKMAEVAPAPAAPTKAAKKKAASKGPKSSVSVNELILRAVSASKERNGVSLPALKKLLIAGGYDVEKNKARVKIAVQSLVTKGALVQTSGTGASGSFKMNSKAAEPKATKPAAKKAAPKKSKSAAKKAPAAARKPKVTAAKKAVATKKSPKKAKKTPADKKAAQGPKKTNTSPKKAVKKTQAVKKTPVKKAAKPKPKKAAPKQK